MTAFRDKSFFARPLATLSRRVALAFTLVAFALPAMAQQGPPIRLSPPGRQAEPPAPAAPTTEPSRPTATPVAPAGPSDPGVRVDTLQGVDPDTAGTLSESQGGFGINMWQGTPRSLVEALLPRLPIGASSPAMRDLMHRLLLSTAAVPQGKSGGTSLAAMRVELLANMGDQTGVNTLLDAIPNRAADERLLRLEADARFLANDNARACVLASGQIRERRDVFWNKAFVFCQALAGELGRAQLGVAVLREVGENDPAFFQFMDRLTGIGGSATLQSLPNARPLHLAMARAAKVQLPKDVVEAKNPGMLRTVAISPNAPVELRLEAAERAEAAGALLTDALRQLYTGVSFSEQELSSPLSKSDPQKGPMGRALLYRTALVQTVPTAQAEAVARALALGREGGRYGSTVRVFAPILKRIPPSAELAWFAPEALRAALSIQDHELAKGWVALLSASALFNQESAAALASLMPLARLAGSSDAEKWQAAEIAAWWDRVKGQEGARAQAALLFSLLEAVDEPVPPGLWDSLLDGPPRLNATVLQPAWWFRIESAAKGGRIGETVLLALIALGEGGPAQSDIVGLMRILTNLKAVGLKNEARTLAVEAAMAAGL
jgi:hypothetical protein